MTTRLLIVVGGEVLGHKLWQNALPRFETKATVRSGAAFSTDRGYPGRSILEHVDVNDNDALLRAFAAAAPTVAVTAWERSSSSRRRTIR